jgi:hypothetical protein
VDGRGVADVAYDEMPLGLEHGRTARVCAAAADAHGSACSPFIVVDHIVRACGAAAGVYGLADRGGGGYGSNPSHSGRSGGETELIGARGHEMEHEE